MRYNNNSLTDLQPADDAARYASYQVRMARNLIGISFWDWRLSLKVSKQNTQPSEAGIQSQ